MSGVLMRMNWLGWVLFGAILLSSCSSGLDTTQSTGSSALLSDRDLTTRMFECIEREGFAGELDLDGASGPGYGFQLSEERTAVFMEVRDKCYSDLQAQGLAGDPSVLPTTLELEQRYPELLAAQQCLLAEGVDVGIAPSLRNYVDGGGVWLPWNSIDLPSTTEEQLNKLLRACPQ